ncbi:MAG TPA: tetratricopeptide repeat protein, partial [Candidatus Acidoferrum sp.]|nr:tetratricopeptide repeat protein [Candidatus Acidoferrum sp.]
LCEERIRRAPQSAFLRNLLGEVEVSQKNYKKAEEAFRKAIELQPDWQAPHINLARVYIVQGQTGGAIRFLEDTLQKDPDNVGAYLSLAQVYIQSKEKSKAIGVYEKLLTRKPDFWIAANDAAFLLSENPSGKKDLERALSLAKKAQEARPEDPEVLDTLGWIHFKMNDPSTAFGILGRAVAYAPENGQINYHMGMASFMSGKKKEAKEYFKKAAESKEAFDGKEEARKMMAQL